MTRFLISIIALLLTLPSFSQRKVMSIQFKNGQTLHVNTDSIMKVDFNIIGNVNVDWTESQEANYLIEELYIFDEAIQKDAVLESFVIRPNDFRLFINSGNTQLKAIEQAGCGDLPEEFYDLNPIIPIYDTSDYSIIGWTIVNNEAEIGLSSAKVKINRKEVTNLDNSPRIRHMLENDKAVVLLGDSFFGQPFDIFTPAILQGFLGQRVYQCGFGGCTMSYRTTNSSFNPFSFTALADAFSTGDFTSQDSRAETLRKTTDYDYRYQLRELKSIDKSKNLLVICDFQTNDFTASVPVGEPKTNPGRYTFVEAQTYGVSQFRKTKPDIYFLFLTTPYRLIDDTSLFFYTNDHGLHITDYITAEEANCKRLDVDFRDISRWDNRSPFKYPTNRTDGTHFTKKGSVMFSKLLLSLINGTL